MFHPHKVLFPVHAALLLALGFAASAQAESQSTPLNHCANRPPCQDDTSNGDCGCDDDSCDEPEDEEDPCDKGTGSETNSYANALSRVYRHEAFDYRTPMSPPTGGCGSCGGSGAMPGDLPELLLMRMHKPWLSWGVYGSSSFGNGIGLSYDANLELVPGPGGAAAPGGIIHLFEYASKGTFAAFKDSPAAFPSNDGVYEGDNFNGHSVHLLDAAGNSVAAQGNAATAEVRFKNGKTTVFEVIPTTNGPRLAGRVIAHRDPVAG